MNTLVINLGLKSIRAIIFNPEGKKIKSSSLPINTLLQGDFVEQDPNEWIQKMIAVIKDVTKDAAIIKNTKYLTVTTSSSCLVPIDSKGNPTFNCIMVSDKRAREEAVIISQSESFRKINNNGFVKCNESLMLPKILWLKRNQNALFKRSSHFLSANDFLIYYLTGEIITDYLNAEKFFFDYNNKTYYTDLLTELDIPQSSLPPAVSIGHNVGRLKQRMLTELKLLPELEVVISTYDAICAFWGSGDVTLGACCEVSGTVTSLRVLIEDDIQHKDLFTQNSGFDSYMLGGSNNLGGGLIEWTKQAFYNDEKYPYEVMEKEAKEVEIGGNGLIFLPYLMGERTPLWDNSARGVFFGLERNHTRSHLTKSIFESTAFSVRTILELIEQSKIKVNKVRVSGGLSRISYINQIKSDILKKEIHVCEEFETTSLGAFMLVLVSKKHIKLEEAGKLSQVRNIVIPNMENSLIYDKIYLLFKSIYQNLKGCFVERSKLVKEIYDEYQGKIENL